MSWRIEDHPDGGLQITHLAAPRFTARWTTGAFPIDQVREGLRRAQPLYYRENRLNSNAVLASSPRRSVHLAGGLRPVSYLPQTKAGHPEGTPFQS